MLHALAFITLHLAVQPTAAEFQASGEPRATAFATDRREALGQASGAVLTCQRGAALLFVRAAAGRNNAMHYSCTTSRTLMIDHAATLTYVPPQKVTTKLHIWLPFVCGLVGV